MSSSAKRILGLDYGSKRIGVAVSDPLRIIAKGISVIEQSPSMMEQLGMLVSSYDIGEIVVGMPLTLKGEKRQTAEEVEKFINRLHEAFSIPVVSIDERFTSRLAQETIRLMGVKKKQRQVKKTIDMTAAALILQQYLDRLDH
ncbi:MAG TPA: Holliday junction resolvase RuvX [Bacteroidota bacterium]|nr:Holliday junction resolvase RuvX [Bacteroidota bacterium]